MTGRKLGIGVASVLIVWMSATTANADEKIGNWTYWQNRDPMTDQLSAGATAVGEGGAVSVKCDAPGVDSVYVQVTAKQYLGGEGGDYGHRLVRFRLDGGTPEENTWIYIKDYAFLHPGQDSANLARRIRSTAKVAFRLSTFESELVDVVVNISGAQEAVDKVFLTCGPSGGAYIPLPTLPE